MKSEKLKTSELVAALRKCSAALTTILWSLDDEERTQPTFVKCRRAMETADRLTSKAKPRRSNKLLGTSEKCDKPANG
jgi:hypothetical protein